VRIEDIDDLGEIGERTGQPVDLVNDNDLNLASLDIGKEPLEPGRSIVPPDRPPSSYMSGSAIQPACRWLKT
jgi:hypothetical protein